VSSTDADGAEVERSDNESEEDGPEEGEEEEKEEDEEDEEEGEEDEGGAHHADLALAADTPEEACKNRE
jgi:hypothetical protein